ncbi:type II secretion system protein [Ureibacillus sp. MALMAid1270]|uniref:type II secretion system protein n=1 Tax=Ureibacillus sp. MALMAid1270 TaxID=3411629 RepID=UPI003BA59453
MIRKNEKGVTLVEVLAVIVLFSIIAIFVFTIISSSTKQQTEQTMESLELQDGAYLLKQITRDLRKSVKLDNQVGRYTFQDQQGNTLFTYEYKDKKLYRNSSLIGNGIEQFSLTGDETVNLRFTIKNKQFETTITLRKGTSIR